MVDHKDNKRAPTGLSRRERQILEILYRSEKASVAEVLRALPDPPSYSSVRTILGVLKEKGHVRHRRQGRVYVYSPTVSLRRASRSALKHVVKTFFDDSVEQVVATLMSLSSTRLSDEEFERLTKLIEDSRRGDQK
ncbi:MAG: BlaI/MecI/CopY family transcriptional regulator [bacterium]